LQPTSVFASAPSRRSGLRTSTIWITGSRERPEGYAPSTPEWGSDFVTIRLAATFRAARRSRTGKTSLPRTAATMAMRQVASGAVRNRTGTPSLPRTAAIFRTTPWSRRESHSDFVGAKDEGDLSHDPAPAPGFEPSSVVLEATLRPALAGVAPRRRIEPLSLGRRPSCDASRITRQWRRLAERAELGTSRGIPRMRRSPRRESNAVHAP
jgi:hypothetical protein